MVTDPDGSAIKRDPLVDYRATATAVIATPHAHARLSMTGEIQQNQI
jgi:hypothetical protein